MKRQPIAPEDFEKMSPFGQWLDRKLRQSHMLLADVARDTGMDKGHLHKISRNYHYPQYPRPGFIFAKRLGILFGDLRGALDAGAYTEEDEVEMDEADTHLSRFVEIETAAMSLSDPDRLLLRETLRAFTRAYSVTLNELQGSQTKSPTPAIACPPSP